MSRATPVPEVLISSNVITDSETGVNTATVLIDVAVGDCSNGFVCLDEPGDLYILRNAIDDYIHKNNIKNPFL
jgi:hypothetical protein